MDIRSLLQLVCRACLCLLLARESMHAYMEVVEEQGDAPARIGAPVGENERKETGLLVVIQTGEYTRPGCGPEVLKVNPGKCASRHVWLLRLVGPAEPGRLVTGRVGVLPSASSLRGWCTPAVDSSAE